MSEWQPISTAPKDGTVVLLRGGVYHGLPFAGQYHDSEIAPGRPWLSLTSSRARMYEHVPTHWMPLPDPPKSVTQNKSETQKYKNTTEYKSLR